MVKIRHSERIHVDIKINEDGAVDSALLCLRTRGEGRESLPGSFGRTVPQTGEKDLNSEVDLSNVVGTKLVTKDASSSQQAKDCLQNDNLRILRVSKHRWKRLTTVESLFASKLRTHGHFVENCYVVYE